MKAGSFLTWFEAYDFQIIFFLLHTPDEPYWVRPKYHTRTKKDEPRYTVDEEIAMMNEQIEASKSFFLLF